jgi:nicotinamidase-related amidase
MVLPEFGATTVPHDPKLNLDPTTTALVLIDLQKGILGMPLAPHDAASVLEKSVALAKHFARLGAPRAFVHVAFAANDADRLNQPVDAAGPVKPAALAAGWAEFTPEIAALEPEIVILKRQWGAFHGTELDTQLRRRGVTTIVLAGIATNFGVEQTAREAWQHNYAVVIAEDACTSVSAEMHQFAISNILPRLARVRATAEILAAL